MPAWLPFIQRSRSCTWSGRLQRGGLVPSSVQRMDTPSVLFSPVTKRLFLTSWFFATDCSCRIVATAMCQHNYSGQSPFTGDVGWVACHPDHRGKGLGLALCARVIQRFLEAGYTAIQLHTEYFRLPAIKTYLRIGFVPLINSSEVSSLWQEACTRLDWPFTPETWAASSLTKKDSID